MNCAFYQFLVHCVYHIQSRELQAVFYNVEFELLSRICCDKILSKVREIVKRDSVLCVFYMATINQSINRPLFMQTNFQQFVTIGCLAKLF